MKLADESVDRAIDHILELCATPSPTGFTKAAEAYLEKAIGAAGFVPQRTRKGSVFTRLGGAGHPLILAAHVDTLGAIVRSVKGNGRIRYSKIGGYPDLNLVAQTCLIHTREGKTYTGTFQPVDASSHVNSKLKELKPDDENLEILVDERSKTREGTLALGIAPGDIVSIDARPQLTPSGFLKSRHLDDKASAGILLALAGLVGTGDLVPGREVFLLFTTYEEVGHGAAVVPAEVEEFLSVDMGAVGDDLACDEHKVSICAKDSNGPYNWDMTGALREAAARAGCDYAVDIYPHYGSDAGAALMAGHDIRHGLVGPGVYASHGYERTHRDAIANTLALLAEYITQAPAS